MNTRFPPEELASLDRWMAAQDPPLTSRPEAVRRLVAQGVQLKG